MLGMKILMYSETDGSWQRVGYDVCYRKLDNHYSCPLLKQGTEYYYLSWKMVNVLANRLFNFSY